MEQIKNIDTKTTRPARLVLCTKEVEQIIGKKERAARRLIAKIKAFFNRPAFSYLTIYDFCAYTGIKEEMVWLYLK